MQGRLDKVLLQTRENLAGARVIRAFGQEKNEMSDFKKSTTELTKWQLVVGGISTFLNPLTYAVVNLGIAALVMIGANQVDSGILLDGDVYALVNYMSQILVELIKLANLIIIETKAVACANRIANVFDTNCSQAYKTDLVAPVSGAPRLQFVNAGLTYKNAAESSVEGINLTVNAGETIGIIGGTGSGKSSFVNLIPRFYDCTEGQLLVDGVDVKDYPKEQLRDKIGIVPQKAVLFSGTIEDNLKWGKADATEEDMEFAIDVAQAKEFVDSKEGRLKFKLNQGAKNLSGGQKQRLTIARALVKKPEILILDDSSSALDYATDAKLRMAIKEKTDNMTVFIVSQRSSSIMHADKIVVLDDGKVCGIGTHNELLSSCEEYQEICSSQNKEEVASNE